MLVLTRKPGEKIVFPSLGVTVQVLHASGRAVRLGVEAPSDVPILRDEIRSAAPAKPAAAFDRHALANALSRLSLAAHLARKQWAVGRPEAADATLAGALEALESLERATSQAQRRTALIVEDDVNERELLAGLLEMNGCRCATAADGEDALAYLTAGGPADVVLLDMAMPRCDGPETLRRIRADGRFARLPVFSVSSTSPGELNVPDGPSGFDGWFPKPLNPRRLWDAIQSAANSPAVSN